MHTPYIIQILYLNQESKHQALVNLGTSREQGAPNDIFELYVIPSIAPPNFLKVSTTVFYWGTLCIEKVSQSTTNEVNDTANFVEGRKSHLLIQSKERKELDKWFNDFLLNYSNNLNNPDYVRISWQDYNRLLRLVENLVKAKIIRNLTPGNEKKKSSLTDDSVGYYEFCKSTSNVCFTLEFRIQLICNWTKKESLNLEELQVSNFRIHFERFGSYRKIFLCCPNIPSSETVEMVEEEYHID